ncbi:MAG: hypothetical protein ACLU18_05705 [Bacteroides thetaiotaomicron]
MKQNIQIAQVELLPRGRGSNNPIKVVEFAASEDNVNWTPIGRFGFTNQDAAPGILCKIESAPPRSTSDSHDSRWRRETRSARHAIPEVWMSRVFLLLFLAHAALA